MLKNEDDAVSERFTQGDLDLEQGEVEQERGGEDGDSWWAMHEHDLVAMAKAGNAHGEDSNRLAIALKRTPWDGIVLQRSGEEDQMERECVERSRLDQVDWGKVQEQLDQQARQEANKRYAKWEKSLEGVYAKPGNRKAGGSVQKAQAQVATWENKARGGTTD